MQKIIEVNLKELLNDDIEIVEDIVIQDLCLDSRLATKGSLFFAVKSDGFNRRNYIDEVISKGAVAILYDPSDGPLNSAVPSFAVDNLRDQVGVIAARFYQDPSKKMFVVAVTGTNGKTSCTHFMAQALALLGQSVGLIGTLGSGVWPNLVKSGYTTPDAVQLQNCLAAFYEQGVKTVVMEVSSHALALGRVQGVQFDVALFTNLSPEHLDFHGNMQRYKQAKESLFHFESLRYAVINVDDKVGQEILKNLPKSVKAFAYALSNIDNASFYFENLSLCNNGFSGQLITPEGRFSLQSSLVGKFNVSNILSVVAALNCLGEHVDSIIGIIPQIKNAEGRMQTIKVDGHATIVIDYAHTPDALEKVLQTLHNIEHRKLWCVFGCGGERDSTKRPVMGAIAAKLSDHVIITDDNPRKEDPDKIAAGISSGIKSGSVNIIHDRGRAITFALENSQAQDIILIAGKGHETEQILGDKISHFSDIEIVKEYLELK